MNGIGWAVKQMRDGHHVARSGWNGKNMWLKLVPAAEPYQEFVAMKTVQNTLVPWLCSQTDLLAVDWEIAV